MGRAEAASNRWLVAGTPGCAVTCGNGVVDPGETCDDGDVAAGDGCNALCELEACYTCLGAPSLCLPSVGTACDDGNVCTLTDVCSLDASCVGLPNVGAACDDGNGCTGPDTCGVAGVCGGTTNVGASCDDGNACTTADTCDASGNCFGGAGCGACQTCDPAVGCVGTACAAVTCDAAPRTGCRAPVQSAKARLLMKNPSGVDRDGLAWSWIKGSATTKSELGAPTSTTGYALCAYDGNASLVFTASAPAGGVCGTEPCWREQRNGFRYRNRTVEPKGFLNVVLKAGVAGKATIAVKGKGGQLGLPSLPIQNLPVVVQLVNGDGGCWEARYGSTLRNGGDQFKALAD